MRVLAVIGVLLGSALRGLQASRLPSAVAVVTIGVALVLVGAFGLLVTNMQGLVDRFGEELQVVAYVAPDVDEAGLRGLAARAATVEGVSGVDVVTRQQAWDRFAESIGGAELLEGLDENPLPASLEIGLDPQSRTPQGLAIVVGSLDGLPGIEELAHGQQWVEGYTRALALVRTLSWGLGAVLVFAAVLIVANTIRLALYSRRDELEILSLVGASRTFVRVPFLIEGTVQGAAGGVLALIVLYGIFLLVLPQLESGLELLIGQGAPRFFAGGEALGLVAAGAGLGVMGSMTALLGWRS